MPRNLEYGFGRIESNNYTNNEYNRDILAKNIESDCEEVSWQERCIYIDALPDFEV